MTFTAPLACECPVVLTEYVTYATACFMVHVMLQFGPLSYDINSLSVELDNVIKLEFRQSDIRTPQPGPHKTTADNVSTFMFKKTLPFTAYT